jgi:hypothetical protein
VDKTCQASLARRPVNQAVVHHHPCYRPESYRTRRNRGQRKRYGVSIQTSNKKDNRQRRQSHWEDPFTAADVQHNHPATIPKDCWSVNATCPGDSALYETNRAKALCELL